MTLFFLKPGLASGSHDSQISYHWNHFLTPKVSLLFLLAVHAHIITPHLLLYSHVVFRNRRCFEENCLVYCLILLTPSQVLMQSCLINSCLSLCMMMMIKPSIHAFKFLFELLRLKKKSHH